MNRTQSKDYRTGTYKINKISLSYFDENIYQIITKNKNQNNNQKLMH